MSAAASPYTEECCAPGAADSAANVSPQVTGREVQVAGVLCYSVGEGAKACVIYSPDVYGLQYLNNRANANHLAAAGFHVVIPDVFEGDPFTEQRMASGGFTELKTQWWPKHTQEHTATILAKVTKQLRKDFPSVQSVQGVGYCYGTVGVLELGKQGLVSSGVLCHPTGHSKDNTDLATIPLLFVCAEQDMAFTPDIRAHWESTLKERMVPAKFVTFPGTSHGFAVRDDGSENGVLQRQRAMQETIAFLKQGAAA